MRRFRVQDDVDDVGVVGGSNRMFKTQADLRSYSPKSRLHMADARISPDEAVAMDAALMAACKQTEAAVIRGEPCAVRGEPSLPRSGPNLKKNEPSIATKGSTLKEGRHSASSMPGLGPQVIDAAAKTIGIQYGHEQFMVSEDFPLQHFVSDC